MKEESENAQRAAKPDPALHRLDPLVGTWQMKGRPVGATRDSITGTSTYRWLPGGFFLQQQMSMNYDGKQIESQELIGYDPETKAFTSQVYSNMAPDPWPYQWDVRDGDWTISIEHGPMNAKFKGHIDGDTFKGGWRPRPGADEAINTPYDIEGTRVSSNRKSGSKALHGA